MSAEHHIAGMTLSEFIELYPGLGYAVAATELQTRRARELYALRYKKHYMQTAVVRAELLELLVNE